jgi:hypothetical protein
MLRPYITWVIYPIHSKAKRLNLLPGNILRFVFWSAEDCTSPKKSLLFQRQLQLLPISGSQRSANDLSTSLKSNPHFLLIYFLDSLATTLQLVRQTLWTLQIALLI